MDLPTLIAKVKYETGLGNELLARRAVDAGCPITRQSIAMWSRGEITQFPTAESIRALSEALGVPARTIIDSIAESLHLHVYRPSTADDPTGDVTVLAIGNRSPAQVEAIRAKVRAEALLALQQAKQE